MAVGTTAAIIAAAVIGAGSAASSANAQKKSAGGRANQERHLAKKKRQGEVATQEAELQRSRDVRAVEDATAKNVREDQLGTQGISNDFGDLDIGALGATSNNTASAALDPVQPNAGI